MLQQKQQQQQPQPIINNSSSCSSSSSSGSGSGSRSSRSKFLQQQQHVLLTAALLMIFIFRLLQLCSPKGGESFCFCLCKSFFKDSQQNFYCFSSVAVSSENCSNITTNSTANFLLLNIIIIIIN